MWGYLQIHFTARVGILSSGHNDWLNTCKWQICMEVVSTVTYPPASGVTRFAAGALPRGHCRGGIAAGALPRLAIPCCLYWFHVIIPCRVISFAPRLIGRLLKSSRTNYRRMLFLPPSLPFLGFEPMSGPPWTGCSLRLTHLFTPNRAVRHAIPDHFGANQWCWTCVSGNGNHSLLITSEESQLAIHFFHYRLPLFPEQVHAASWQNCCEIK